MLIDSFLVIPSLVVSLSILGTGIACEAEAKELGCSFAGGSGGGGGVCLAGGSGGGGLFSFAGGSGGGGLLELLSPVETVGGLLLTGLGGGDVLSPVGGLALLSLRSLSLAVSGGKRLNPDVLDLEC